MKLSISSPEMMDQHAKQAVILVAIATLFAEGVVSEGSNITLKSRGTPMEAALSLVNNMVAIFRNQIMNQSNSSYAALSNLPKIFGSLNLTTIAQQLEDTDLVKKIISTFPNGKVNQNCFRDTIYTLTSIITLKKWALNMFDATGKIESGIQKGHFYFIGSFDQCYGAEPKMQTFHSEAGGLTKTRTFGTRFCRADISIPDSLVKGLNVDTRGVKLKLTWGLCVPDSCKSTDVDGMLNSGSMFNISLPIEKVFCYEEEALSSDTSAIVATCILSLFALLITCGTLIDAYRAYFELGHITSTNNINLSTSRDLPSGKSTKLMEANGKTWMNNTISNDNSEPLPLEHNENIKNKKMNDDGYVEKAELEIALPAGYVAHRETQIQINRSDTAIVNSAIQQSTPGRTSTLIKSQQDKMVVRLLLCFSVYTNIPKILNAKVSSGSVACIHGIRFFSLTWVVLGHTYNYGIISMEETLNAANLLDFVGILQRFTYQTVVAGGFAVDTFFVLSAFLLTWLHLKDKAKEEKKCTLWASVYFYFHRFWRLTPIYMFVMMAFACLYKYLGSGPMWPSSITTAENCKQYWWTNLLYINNLVHVDNQCMGWSWYLANDMQFYVISPVFLLAMIMSPIYGAVLTCILLAVGIACAFWKEYIYNGNFFTMKEDGGDYWREVYIVPWCRVGCWAVGMLLGLLVFHRDGKPLRNKIIIRLGWLLATAVALFLVYIPYTEQKKDGEEWTRVHRAFYEGFGRPAWGVCIAWVIFACLSGKGGIVNTILSWNGFIPLSRLTYSAYLVHPICMMVNIWSRRTLLYVSDYTIIYLFLGHLCMTYMVSFVCSLAFEAPFMALEKLLFRRERRS